MYPAYNAFSVLTKGYACGLGDNGGGGYEAFAIFSKGYVCIGAVPEVLRGGDSSKRALDTSMDALLVREDEEVLAIIMAIGRR